MGKLSKRMKRLLAILLVEVIVASNVFISYADEDDDGIMYQISEEDIADEVGDEPIVAYSDGDEEEEHVEDDSSDETSDEEEYTEDVSSGEEEDFSNEEEISSEENNGSGDPAQADGEDVTEEEPDEEDGFEAVECICDTVCTSDSYNVNCPVCVDAVDADDVDAFFADHCKGEKEEKTEEPDEEEKIEPEIISVDNSVSVTAVCVVDGEEIEEAGSFEINVEGTVDVLEKAPEIEGYTFADKATVKDDGSDITQIQKESVEEKEETEIDGKKVVTKITTTTSMSYYDGTQWKDLEDDITVAFEYTQNEETDEETAAVKFIASFVDQDGNAIEGYTNKTLTFDDTLDLTKAPVTIENYEYVEAQIGDAVVSSINKKTETNEKGEEVVTYSYTADGEEVEVNEDTEVTLVYEGGEEAVEAEVTLICVDEEGLAIAGYEKAELPEFAEELILDDPEKAPVVIEGYDYKEAMVDGAVITSLVKEAAEESDDAETEEGVFVYSYVTKDGETVVIEEDTEITLSYEEAEVAVLLDATIVDEFGDEIAEKYTNMDISKIFDKNDELTLDDPETPPVKKVSVRQSLFKTIKYTYVKASVNDEIIKGLQRKAIESEDVKASDREYAYSYTTDGETWEKIKEDTTVIFEYSDGKKTTYTYEDSFVSVTATLQHANAIPDDAEFVVTPVTPSTSGYNYDAYMEALNANADQIGDSDKKESSDKDAKKYTEDNTLLYDIAFLAEQVDEEGNAIEGSKVEYQPAEGMVKISFTFKQKQLEEDLNAEKAGDVTVVHMPLADDVKESAGTTADATGISASDVNVEVVSGGSTSIAAEQVDFSLSDFSLIGFVGVESQLDLKPGTSYTYRDILGNAIYYGITANTVKKGAHMDSNFATKYYTGNGNISLGAYTGGKNPGMVVVGEMGEGSTLSIDGTSSNAWCTAEDADKITVGGQKAIASKESINNYVNSLYGYVNGVSSSLFTEKSYDVKEYDQNGAEINISECESGTYYINGDFLDGVQPWQLKIKKNSNQTIVFNISRENVTIKGFSVEDVDRNTGLQSSANSGSEMDLFAQTIVFNMPNAKTLKLAAGCVGIFIAPKASTSMDGTSSGWMVTDTLANGGAEWHCVWGEMPDSSLIPVPAGFTAAKMINSEKPNGETFTFVMEELGEGKDYHVEVTNNGSMISFPNIEYREQGTYYYRVFEKSSNEDSAYAYDKTQYIVKVEVSTLTEGEIGGSSVTTCKIDSITYYKSIGEGDASVDDAVEDNSVSAMSFNNIKEEKGSIEVKKVTNGGSPDAGPFYFVLTGPDGKPVAKEDGTVVYEISANGTVKIEGLAVGIYHLKETNSEGKDIATGKEFPYAVAYSSDQIEVKTAETTEFTIWNTYEKYETEGSLPLSAHKSYNRSLLGNDFHFTVTENGKTILEADNDTQGNINFGSISYKGLEAEGDHIYEIREQKGDKNGINYSGTVYTLTVNVKDDGNHRLIPTIVSLVDQDGKEVDIDKLEFKNEYKATGQLNLKASKTVDKGVPAEDEVFVFELWNSNEDGDLINKIEEQRNNFGEITFGQIDYDQSSIGTHYYLVKETGAKKGYDLDTKQYLVKVIVSDNDLDGTLEVAEEYFILSALGRTSATSIAFDNTYKPTEGSVVIRATKGLNNGNISNYIGKFNFTLEGPGVKGGKETVSNTGENGTDIVFSEIKYGKDDIGKDYTYTITEEASTLGSVVANDPVSVRQVIVEVRADRVTGEVVATPKYQPVTEYPNDKGAVFHNEYHASGSVTLEGSKVLTGKDLTKEMFNFVVMEDGETVATGTNDENGKITFTEITYDKADSHVYTISEVIPQEAKENNNVLNGITYDARRYKVTVTLTDDGQGNLIHNISYPESGIVFENEYNVIPVDVTLEGTKILTGRDMKEGEFSFEVVEIVGGEEVVVATGSNEAAKKDEEGKIVFSTIDYKEAGTHTYTVREVKGGSTENGVSYADNTFEVVVKITDNGLGGLEKNVQYVGGGIAFSNSYDADGQVTLKAHKTVDGAAPAENEIFTFEVLENNKVIRTAQNSLGDVVFEEAIQYTLSDVGTHTYTIREKRERISGYSYDLTEYKVEVVVSDRGNGKLIVSEPVYKKGETPVEENAVVFNNIKDGSTVIEASKELLGGGMLESGMFTFSLTSSDDSDFTPQEVTNDGARVVFNPIIYTRDDITHTYHYTITEKPSTFAYITNDKVAERRVAVTVNEVSGKIVPSVVYEPVTEYPGDEGAVFHNAYSAEGHATISGTKELTGRDIASGEFTFGLYSVGANNSETFVSDARNTVNGGKGFSFEPLTFTSIGTYVYRVREMNAGTTVNGVTYDPASFDVTIVVTDNNNGTLHADVIYPEGGIKFKNSYTARETSISLDGTKNMTGRPLVAGEFEFEVKAADGTVVSTGKNDAEGKIAFSPIEYKAAGTYGYTVSEKKHEGHVNGVYHGVTYDSNIFTVTVDVTDDGNGQLVATKSQSSPNVVFNNVYSASGQFTLSASKKVDGNSPKEDEVFIFMLSGGYGNKQQNQTVTNNGEAITFEPIDYDQSDIGKTFVYTVTESAETLLGYDYDESVYRVEVTVTDEDSDGVLEINPVYYEDETQVDGIVFDNDYIPAAGEVKLQATKLLENGTLTKDNFWFTLTSEDHEGFAEQRVSNDGTQVKFAPISYTKNDIDKTYHYIIKEEGPENGKLKGVTYDTARERHVTVEVKAVNGQIVATETYEVCDAHSEDGNAAIFHNSYDAEGSFTPQGTKTLNGRDMGAGEFWFVIEENGRVLQRVSNEAAKNKEAGKINFAEIHYTLDQVGIHTYTVSEENAGEAKNGVKYGNNSYTITVDVRDNHDGTLNIVDTYSPEVVDKTMVFTNTYDAKGGIKLTGTKTLTGRNMEVREFNFVVMEGNIQVATGTNTSASNGKESAITFTEIPYTLDDLGDHTYTITEVPSNLKGVAANDQSFTVVVNVADEKDGNLKASVKSITGFNSSGEEIDKIAFENTYTASVSLELEALKTVNGSSELADGQTFTFTLEGGLEGKMVSQSKTNGKDGKVTFDPISYDQQDIDKTFIYTVKESAEGKKKGYTYDGTVYTVEVTVVRDDTAANGLRIEKVVKAGQGVRSDGVISFNNTYPRAGRLDLQAYKDYNGQLVDGMFSFILKGPKLPADGQTKSNVGNTVTFDVIPLDESDVGETYVYTITEQTDESKKDYVSYDEKLSRSVTVEVGVENGEVKATSIRYSSAGKYTEDDGRNMAIFHNTYKANASLNLVGTKTLTGRLLTENDKFDFVVIDKNKETDNVVATGVNNGKDITFSPITYDQSQIGKSYTYQIKELVKDGSGIYCDRTIYEMTVKVTDPNHDGTLVLEYSYPTGGLVFNNTYTATDGEIEFTGTKKMTGRELTENDHFTFAVYEVINGQEVAVPATTGTSTGSVITFGKIRYDSLDDVGIHTYHVKEAAYGQNGVKSIDGVVRTVKVNVSDGGNGKLDAVLTSDSEAIEFTNEYHATGELQLEAWKTVNGAAPGNREFSFTLSNDKDGKTDTTNNAGDGHVVFGKITFTEKDVVKSPITYTIEENVPTGEAVVEGMVYDQSKYTVTVELVDDGKGNITVNPETIKYVKDGQELDNALFNNTYEANGQIVIEASKRLEGGNLKDDQFTFILKDENGAEIDRVTNKGTNVTFKSITYTLEDVGPHAYTVEEYHAGATGYTYDGTIFTVNVNVVDNGPGELSVTKEYVGVDGIPEFVNGYIPMEIEISKVDAVSLNELAGASMSIIGENGETLDAWVSDGGRHVFKADYDKTYTLTETAAPAGFLIADSITFRIDSDGVLWIMQADGSFAQQADSVVTMVDVAAPTPTPTPTPSDEPTPTPGDEPTPTPGDEPTPTPGDEPTPTPGDGPTPTPGDGPTPTPGENPTPGTQITPPHGNGQTPAPGDEDVLGARRGRGAVLGARRAPRTAVLGARRRPATGDTLALFIWIMVLSLSMGGAVVSSTMLKYNGKKRKR